MGKKNTESTSSEATGASATPSATPVGVADLEGIIQKAIDAALNVLRTEFDKVFTEMNQRIDSHSDEIVMLKIFCSVTPTRNDKDGGCREVCLVRCAVFFSKQIRKMRCKSIERYSLGLLFGR